MTINPKDIKLLSKINTSTSTHDVEKTLSKLRNLEKGFIDMIIDRKDLKEKISQLLRIMKK